MRFNDSVLAIDVEAVAKVQGDDALCGLWNVFTKCKDSLREGPRLENIAWRLWHREVFSHHGVARDGSGTEQHLLLCPDDHQPPAISPIEVLSSISDGEEDTLVGTVDIYPLSPDPSSGSVLNATTGRRSVTRSESPTAPVSTRSSSHPSARSSAISTSCSILDSHHRTNSAPNRLIASSASIQVPTKAISPGRSSMHIGQIISSLLPEKVNLSHKPRRPAAAHGPVPNVLDVLSHHGDPHDQPPNFRTTSTSVLIPPPSGSRQESARRLEYSNAQHPAMCLPSSVSSVSSSSSCASYTSSIAGPSTPPPGSFVPPPAAGPFGPPEAESQSGSATPRAPTSPTRTRSPANSSPRTSLYNSSHSNPPAPSAAASHLNTNDNRLSISARSAATTLTPSEHPSNANHHHPTVILTNPTPRPTPPSTPSQPLSPADTPASPIPNFTSPAQQTSTQFVTPQRSLARTATTTHLLSYQAMSQQQRRATPQLLAVPFAIPPSPRPEPSGRDNARRNNEKPVDSAVDGGDGVKGSQSPVEVGQPSRGFGYVESGPRSGNVDMLRMTPVNRGNTSIRAKVLGNADARPLAPALLASPFSQPIEENCAQEYNTGSSPPSSESQYSTTGASTSGVDAARTINGAALTGTGKIPNEDSAPVAPTLDDVARNVAARKIFFIQRSPPGEDRFVDGASSASSGTISTSLMGASIGAASSSKSPLVQRPPSSVLRPHIPSPTPQRATTVAADSASKNEVIVALLSPVAPLSPAIAHPTSTAPPSVHGSAILREQSHDTEHDLSARTRSHLPETAPVMPVPAESYGNTRKLSGSPRHVSYVVHEDTNAGAALASSTAPLEEQHRTLVTGKEEQSSDNESIAASERANSSLPHDHPAPLDRPHLMDKTTLPTTRDPHEARGKKTVRAVLPKSNSHANLHRKGARGVTLGLARLTKAGHENEKRAASLVRPKASRQTSGGSTSQTGGAPADGGSAKRKSGAWSNSKAATRQNSIDSTASSSTRSISHSRSPGSVSGTHRTFISSPLSTGTVPAPVTNEPLTQPPPLVAAAPSNGASKRPPMPGRSHTSASIMRPPTDTHQLIHSHAMKPQHSKSPSKRSQHHASPAKAGGSTAAAVTGARKRPVLDMTSSDSDATSDDSMWSSADEEEEEIPLKGANKGKGRASDSVEHKETGHLARDAALEAARQRDMFRKVPSRSYSNLGLQRQTGLLTPLLNPDPRLVPYLPPNVQSVMAQLGRPHNSAQNLGRRPAPLAPFTTAPPAAHTSTSPTPVLKPSKSAAEVRIAPVSVTTQVVVNPSGRPGYRLKGRPDGAEVESDDEDELNPLDVDGMSKSLAQRKLERLAGLGQKQRSQQHVSQQSAMPSRKGVAREHRQRHPYPSPEASYIPSETQQQEYYPYHSVELTRTPSMPLPHPYNLPAPAPPQSPRTTRRQMMANEMSESLRRNLLWERTLSRRMLGGFTRINPALPANGRTSGSGAQQHVSRTSVEARGPPTPLSRTKSWADDYHATGW